MWLQYVDKTILNLLTILMAGAGLFAILTKFDVPQLRLSFFGENLYAIKRDVIERMMFWIFIGVATFGLLIQTYNLIFGNQLKERSYNASFYIIFVLVGLVGVIVLLFFLGTIGKCIAKKIWQPQIVQKLSEGFQLAGEIIKNKGYYNEELDQIDRYFDEQKKQKPINRYKQCDEILDRTEELLEIHNIFNNRKERYKNLKKYFQINS